MSEHIQARRTLSQCFDSFIIVSMEWSCWSEIIMVLSSNFENSYLPFKFWTGKPVVHTKAHNHHQHHNFTFFWNNSKQQEKEVQINLIVESSYMCFIMELGLTQFVLHLSKQFGSMASKMEDMKAPSTAILSGQQQWRLLTRHQKAQQFCNKTTGGGGRGVRVK